MNHTQLKEANELQSELKKLRDGLAGVNNHQDGKLTALGYFFQYKRSCASEMLVEMVMTLTVADVEKQIAELQAKFDAL